MGRLGISHKIRMLDNSTFESVCSTVVLILQMVTKNSSAELLFMQTSLILAPLQKMNFWLISKCCCAGLLMLFPPPHPTMLLSKADCVELRAFTLHLNKVPVYRLLWQQWISYCLCLWNLIPDIRQLRLFVVLMNKLLKYIHTMTSSFMWCSLMIYGVWGS